MKFKYNRIIWQTFSTGWTSKLKLLINITSNIFILFMYCMTQGNWDRINFDNLEHYSTQTIPVGNFE